MVDGEALLGRLEEALTSNGGATEADLYARHTRRGIARYALNTLSQHAELDEVNVTARVALPAHTGGWRVASVTTTDVTPDGLRAVLSRAREVASLVIPRNDWPGFAPPSVAPSNLPSRFGPATASFTAGQRADHLTPALAHAREQGLHAAGVLESQAYAIAVANTRGVALHASGTTATFKMFALDPDGVSGFAQTTQRDVDAIDVLARAHEACARSKAGHDPVALPAGDYDVILEPPAVVELLEWMAFVTFGGRAVLDGTSPLGAARGTLITGPGVTIVDDAHDASPLGSGVPFDRDGVLRRRVTLIDAGRIGEPVTDRVVGARLGLASTGHAAPPTSEIDDAPIAQSVQMLGGDDTVESLMARVDRGLLISRFHYVNGFLEPRVVRMTGLTRDGTFLIERGVRTRGVRNMRFTDSVLEAFGRIDGITQARSAVRTWWSEAGSFVAPTLLIRGLRFTGGGVATSTG